MKDKLTSGCNLDTRTAKKLRTDRAGKTLIPQCAHHANSSNCSEIGLSGRNKGKEISDSDPIGEANLRRYVHISVLIKLSSHHSPSFPPPSLSLSRWEFSAWYSLGTDMSRRHLSSSNLKHVNWAYVKKY